MIPTVTVSGTAFTAVSVNVKNRAKQELQDEQISLGGQKTSGADDKESKFAYKTNQVQDEGKQTVVFDDAKSGKKVAVLLDKNTIEKLKTHFGEDDAYAREDGIVRLNNKAEAFVAAWFGDVAYNRDVINADTDGDNKISKEEYKNTKSFFGGGMNDGVEYDTSGNIYSISDTVGETYRDGSKLSATDYLENLKSDFTSLDEILNEDINTNANFDNKITLEEILKYDYKTENLTIAAAKDMKDLSKSFGEDFSGLDNALDELITKNINKKHDKEDEQKKKLEALQKLIASGGDIGVLNAEEQALLQNELSKYSKNTDNKYDVGALQSLQETTQKTNEYKNVTTDDNLGKYYKDRG